MTSTATSPSPARLRQEYAERAARLAEILDGVGERADAPTPCDGWTVRDVVQHLVDTEREFVERHGLALPAAGADGAGAGGSSGGVSGGSSGDALAAAWRAHAAVVVEVLDDAVLATSYDGFFGPTTIGETLRDFYTWDIAVHAWDVARATGQEYELDEADAHAHDATADGWGDALYSEGICGGPVAVPGDASAWEKLLGRLGRDPGWSAG